MNRAAGWIAEGFGLGRLGPAPGTLASAAALVPAALMLAYAPALLPWAVLAATLAGLWAIARLGLGAADPGRVVIDEIAGQWLALLALPGPSWQGLGAGFLLFRFLDIVKPGPVGWADRQQTAAGVMGDDLAAGLLAAGVLWAVGARWPGIWSAR